MNELKEIKELIEVSEKYHSKSIDEAKTEAEQDTAYTLYWETINKIAALLCKVINIDENTAKKMAVHKKDEIIALINRAER